MSKPKWAIHRRAFLKGFGASISLPFLEAMLPFAKASAQSAAQIPPRMVYIWFDLGVHRDDWLPGGSGQNWTLPSVLSPLQAHKNNITMLRRVRNYYGDSHNEGGGDHARSIGTFLTCAHSRYGNGHNSADFGLPTPNTARLSHEGPQDTAGFAAFHARAYGNKIQGSADQIAARLAWNNAYQIKSLQMRRGGGGDSHHNSVNQNLSWTSYNTPAPRYQDLHSMFDAIFQRRPVDDGSTANLRAAELDKSILDTVGPTVTKLNTLVGREDRLRLEKYLTEVRELERKISSTRPAGGKECGLTTGDRPPTAAPRFDDHIRMTLSLYVKAFQCDITRVTTHGWDYGNFSFLRDAAGRTLDREPHNEYSHHNGRVESVDALRRINRFWAELFAGFLTEMKQADNNFSGTLLDNSQILFGCGMQDGNRHDSDNSITELPIVIAGRASGRWTPGKVIDTGNRIKLSDIHLNMLKNMGYTGNSFGDSDGQTINL